MIKGVYIVLREIKGSIDIEVKIMKRYCGNCVACCVYPNVDQEGVKKEALYPCSKLIDSESLVPPVVIEEGKTKDMPLFESKHYCLPGNKNCTIYKRRPRCCFNYRCVWLEGHGEENDRPDKCGILFDTISRTGYIENSIIAKPLWFGADEEKVGIKAIENISRSMKVPVLVVQFTEFRLLRVVGRGIE